MTRSVWSCFSKVSETPEGYVYGERYAYDSHVVNSSQLTVGDLLVVRDRQLVFGYGVVEEIEQRRGVKVMTRCPHCRSSKLKPRTAVVPRYRCPRCHEEFDIALQEPTDVVEYSASYGAAWILFDAPIPVRALDSVYANADRQNAIRRLDVVRAHAMLRFHLGVDAAFHLSVLAQDRPIDGGHVEVLVKQRIGQQRFRERLFERYGETCAVTGSQPAAVLDAAHLYTFAERPEHESDGGLLLRADVHRMFDRLLITFDPVAWRSRVSPRLLDRHERLRALDQQPMLLPDGVRPNRGLIELHHAAAQARWREVG